jgi:hypothetical protein
MCQEGVDRVSWHAHGISYCNQSPGSCPPQPAIVPVKDFVAQPWNEKAREPMACIAPPTGVPKFTVGMLSRKETESLINTLETYEKSGFLQVRAVALVVIYAVWFCIRAVP